MIKKNKENIWL